VNYLNFRCVAERTYGAGVATAIYRAMCISKPVGGKKTVGWHQVGRSRIR
jgi:hypothetical protein